MNWFEPLKVVVFTCITDNYDDLKKPRHVVGGWDYLAFVDSEFDQGSVGIWNICQIPIPPGNQLDPIKLARWIKIMGPQLLLKEYDLTIWVDGKLEIVGDLTQLLSQSEFAFEFGIAQHRDYRCVYTEFEAVKRLRKDTNVERLDQMKQSLYELKGHPHDFGLWDTCFMVRKKCQQMDIMMNDWWRLVENHSHRDQLSLPAVMFNGSLEAVRLFQYVRNDVGQFLELYNHKTQSRDLPKIKICTPFQYEDNSKDLGKAYNEYCRQLILGKTTPDKVWVLVQDYDVMWLNPNFYRDFQEAILLYPDTGIFTCYASRTANRLQQLPKVVDDKWGSNNPDINYHREIAFNMPGLPGESMDITEEAKKHAISGFTMLFNLLTYAEVGGFVENGQALGVDNDFAWRVIKAGYRIRRVESIYCLHYYRLDQGQHVNSHLT